MPSPPLYLEVVFVKRVLRKFTNFIYCASISVIAQIGLPTAFAADTGGGYSSLHYVVELINTLLKVFNAAGIILLAYSVFALIMAIKDENIESKVHATTQLVVAIVLITFSTILSEIGAIVDVPGIG